MAIQETYKEGLLLDGKVYHRHRAIKLSNNQDTIDPSKLSRPEKTIIMTTNEQTITLITGGMFINSILLVFNLTDLIS
jgi:hypothetical protein